MIVLDTTVLAYAVGGDHPLRAPCRSIFDAATGGHIDARTTTFVIQEFAHVRARRHGRAEAARRARTFAEILHPLLATEEEHLDHALALFERHDELGAFDAFLAVTALAGGCTLVSADRDFAAIDGLAYVDPASPELETLLRD